MIVNSLKKNKKKIRKKQKQNKHTHTHTHTHTNTHTHSLTKSPVNMLTIRVDCERINGCYTNAEYREKIILCDLTLNTGPYAVGCVRAHLAGKTISKSCGFSTETEFISLVLASKSAPRPPPPCKTLKFAPPFSNVWVRAWKIQLF